MTSKELLDATMHLEMKYLDEANARADAVIPAARKKIRLLPALTTAAACLTAVIGLRMYLLHNNGMTEQNSTPDSLVAEVTDTETTASATETQIVTTLSEGTEHAKKDNRSSKGTSAATTAASAKKSTTTTAAPKTTAGNNTDGKQTDEKIKVPDFTGMTWEQAKPIAKSKGLLLARYDICGNGAGGQIHSQKPAPDAAVKKGDVIELTVFNGHPEGCEATLMLPIPKGVTGHYYVKGYDESGSDVAFIHQEIKAGTVDGYFPMHIEGYGTETYDIVLVDMESDREEKLARVRVDYERKTMEIPENNIFEAFRKLDELTNDSGSIQASALELRIEFAEQEPHEPSSWLNMVDLQFQIPEDAWGMYRISAHGNISPDYDCLNVFNTGDLYEYYQNRVIPVAVYANYTTTVDYAVKLLNIENNREATIGRYRVDFSTETYEVLEENIEAAFAQVGNSERPSAQAGDFDLDGRITGADVLLADLIEYAECNEILDLLPLTEEQLKCADILPGETLDWGLHDEPNRDLPLSGREVQMISKTWTMIRDCGCTGLTVSEYISNQAYYEELRQKCSVEQWEREKDQIDWTKLGLSGIPTYHEFKMLTDDEYMFAHTENWDSLSGIEKVNLREKCWRNNEAYQNMKPETWDSSAFARAGWQMTAYYCKLIEQKTGEPSIFNESPTWEEVWELIEAVRDSE
ncbi:MAG: PASTA domain-containing protein [Selenomonas sp.]|nr:PASTA domain-containing protein [Selenomonas sp.]